MENLLSLVPTVHLLPLVNSRNNESSPKLPFYMARLIIYCHIPYYMNLSLAVGKEINEYEKLGPEARLIGSGVT